MTNLFQLLSNVSHLKVEIFSLNLNGHQLEQIIINYLSQLKILQLKVDLHLYGSIDGQDNEERVDKYLAQYRSPFWIEHHQWFIRCHWRLWMENLSICLYTLPYKFDYFPILASDLNSNTKSTYPDVMHFSYDSIRNIRYELWLFNNDMLTHIQLTNIKILSVQLPIDHRFLLNIPKLENLCSFVVKIPTTNYQSHLQILLDNVPYLYSLAFESWTTLTMPPYRCTSASVCRLDLEGSDQSSHGHCYDTKQCIKLSRSPLGIQCRVLIIEIEDVESIVALIYYIINLRTLRISYKYDKRTNKYNLVELLQNCLPSTWTVTRFCYGNFLIQT